MDNALIFNLLLILHLLALAAGGGTMIAMRVVGGLMASASPEQRQGYMNFGRLMGRSGQIGLGLLLITGPLMVWVKYGGMDGMTAWFWAKMGLILVLIVAIAISARGFRAAQQAGKPPSDIARAAGIVGPLAFLGVVICAVFAFN